MKLFLAFLITPFFSALVYCQSIQPSGSASFCAGGNITLNTTGAAASSTFQWRNNGNNIGGATLTSLLVSAAGNYSVIVKPGTGNTPDTLAPVVITVTPKPVADFTFSNNSCSGVAVPFTATITSGTAPFKYTWDFGDGGTSTSDKPSHTFTSLGCGTASFNVKLTVTDSKGCVSNIVTKNVTIKQAPNVQVTDLTNPARPFNNCNNDPTPANPDYTITVENISPDNSCIKSYSIDWGDGDVASNISFPLNHTYKKLGAFNLIISAIGNNDCAGSKKYTVANQKNPDIGIGTFGPTEGCSNLPISIVLSLWETNSPGTTYFLEFGDGQFISYTHPINLAFTNDTIPHTYTTTSCPNAFNYPLRITAANACRTKTFTGGDIVVKTKPISDFDFVIPVGCINQPVCFTNTTAKGYDVNCNPFANTSWDFGDPASGANNKSSAVNPCHTFSSAGTYTVTLTTSNFCGPSVLSKQVCIEAPLSPGFTVNSLSGCRPFLLKTVDTTNQLKSCKAALNKWDVTYTPAFCGTLSAFTFSNNTSDTSSSPSFNFTNAGAYTIIQNVTNACGTFTASQKIDIKQPPVVTVNVLNVLCSGEVMAPASTVQTCGTTSPTYSWTFDGGTPGTASSINPGIVSFTTIGNHKVLLEVTNECGTTGDSAEVNIIAPPTANAGNDKTICSDESISIGVAGIVGIIYNWSPLTGLILNNDGTADVSLVYDGVNADTSYQYVLTASGGKNCSSTDTMLLTVKKRPVVKAKAETSAVCEGLSTSLTAAGAVSYAWFPPSSLNVSNKDTVIATPSISTVYEVIGTGANGCTDTTLVSVFIQQYPITDAGNDSIVCNNTSAVQFNGSPTGGTWLGNNVTTGGLFNPFAAGNGNYFLKYTAAINQCSKTDSLKVTVIDPPIAKAGNDTTVCQDTSIISFNGSPAGGNWSGSALITASGDFTSSTPGAYQLIYTFGSGSCISKDTLLVTVSNAITNNIISPSQSICINTKPVIITGLVASGGNGIPAYQWQQSIDGSAWSSIPGETALNYAAPILTTSIYYRRIAYTTLCTGAQGSFSEPVKITVREDSKAAFSASKNSGCFPFDLGTVINVTSFADRNGLYKWYAAGSSIGNNSIGFFPGFIMQNTDDTIIIKLVTNSQFGCKPDSMEQQFITFKTAIAKFIKGNAKGCGPLNVPFTNTSNLINNGIKFFWDFGNGIKSNLAQPGSIPFTASPFFTDTTYYVTLKAYNGCDTTIFKDSVQVRANPKARFGVPTTTGCSPFTVQVNNTSLGGPSTYYWDFGNGYRDTTFSNGLLNYTYNTGNAVDTFTIQLIAVNECGRDTQSIDIRIAPNIIRPQININGSDLFGCIPHIVRFNNSTSGATNYRWDFADGTPPIITTNNETKVVHTFTEPGDYDVQIDISNGCTDTTVFRQITVYAKPKAIFTTNEAVYCLGDTVRVNNISTNATNYRWFWGDGQSSAGLNPVHVYAIAGNYDVYLRAERTNNFGLVCYDTLIVPITVLIKPDVRIQTNISNANCAPFNLSVTAPGIINESVTWYFYDSTVTPEVITATGVSAAYIFNNAGTFSVKIIAANSFGCKDSTEKTFIVKGTPAASFTPVDLAVCKTDTTIPYFNTTVFKDNGPVSYRWLVDDIQFSTNGNFTHQYKAGAGVLLPKVFTTSLIATNTIGCSDTAIGSLQLSPSPKASFTISNPTNCVPFIVAIADNSNYITNYKWLLNGQLVSTDANPSIVITESSTAYQLTLIGDNIYGCKPDTFSINFISRIKPTASFSVNDTLGCTGVLNIITNNKSSNATSFTWDWGDASPTVSFNSPTYLYNTLGEYKISLIASDGGCKDTVSQLVKVAAKTIVDFSVDQTIACDTARVQFSNLSQHADNYTWSFGDGTTSTEVNPSKSLAPKAAPYTVKLIAFSTSGCKDSLTKTNLILAKVPPAADFSVSPTPVITVPNYTFSFYNLTLNSNKYTYQWDLGDGGFASTRDIVNHKYLDTGNYFVQLIVLDTNINCPDTIIKIARIDGFPGYLYVPNAFYPNSIQTQFKTFKPIGKGLAEYQLQIFDSWGRLLFESRELDATGSPVAGWDGTIKGNPMQQDTYAWKIVARFKNGKQWDGMIYTNIPGKKSGVTFGTLTLFR